MQVAVAGSALSSAVGASGDRDRGRGSGSMVLAVSCRWRRACAVGVSRDFGLEVLGISSSRAVGSRGPGGVNARFCLSPAQPSQLSPP